MRLAIAAVFWLAWSAARGAKRDLDEEERMMFREDYEPGDNEQLVGGGRVDPPLDFGQGDVLAAGQPPVPEAVHDHPAHRVVPVKMNLDDMKVFNWLE